VYVDDGLISLIVNSVGELFFLSVLLNDWYD
jgi:hypothetical protein